MRCPACGGSKLKLGIVFAGEVACTFHDDAIVEILDAASLDSYWTEDSACHCIQCDWSGRVRELSRPGRESAPVPTDRDRSRLAEIERRAISGSCPKPIRRELRQLVSLIHKSHDEVRILENARRASAQGGGFEDGDTIVF